MRERGALHARKEAFCMRERGVLHATLHNFAKLPDSCKVTRAMIKLFQKKRALPV